MRREDDIPQTTGEEEDEHLHRHGTLRAEQGAGVPCERLSARGAEGGWAAITDYSKRCVLESSCFKMQYLYDIFVRFPIKLRALGSKCYNLQKIQSEHGSVCLCTGIKFIN